MTLPAISPVAGAWDAGAMGVVILYFPAVCAKAVPLARSTTAKAPVSTQKWGRPIVLIVRISLNLYLRYFLIAGSLT